MLRAEMLSFVVVVVVVVVVVLLLLLLPPAIACSYLIDAWCCLVGSRAWCARVGALTVGDERPTAGDGRNRGEAGAAATRAAEGA
jgi:hypothetical protein